ncbi:hypothetical protein M413DRAFT_420330, partial [Hebeloma cylindrosporum]
SRRAPYNADLEGEATLSRVPCTPGTRTDILKRIYDWALDSSPESPHIFWMTGQAGSGKTTIGYTVAHYFDEGEEVPNVLQASFCCSRQFEDTRRQRLIIPTLVYQLARHSKTFAQALLAADKFDSVDIPSKQMQDLLVGPWEQSSANRPQDLLPYLVVIDALDEIEGRGGSDFLRSLITAVQSGHLQGLKFFVTSRPDPELASLCQSFSSDAVCCLYDVAADEVDADIAKYLHAALPALRDEPEITKLVHHAGGLFIYASTAVRYMSPHPDLTKDEQCSLMGKLLGSSSNPKSAEPSKAMILIDTLYRQILSEAFSGLDDELISVRLKILHNLLCTQERVSTSVAAELFSESAGMVNRADSLVRGLHAVLHIENGRVLWYHASFPDFIFTQERFQSAMSGTCLSNRFCSSASHHALLARSCFRIMMSGLRFNICDLPSSYLFDSEVPNLHVEEKIHDALKYSCQYWGQHLVQAALNEQKHLHALVVDFLPSHVLFWIEAMNLLKLSVQCAHILQQVRKCILKHNSDHLILARNITEAGNFATYFVASPAVSSTPHLYISALAMWSQTSAMSEAWKKQFSHIPTLGNVRDNATELTSSVGGLIFSPDGSHIVSGSDDKSVRVWDALTGAELRQLHGHTGFVPSVAFSPDGTHIVSGSWDKSVRVCNIDPGLFWTLTTNGWI